MLAVPRPRFELDRAVAVSAAVVLNLAAFTFLRALNVQRPSETPDASDALQIVWVPRAAPAPSTPLSRAVPSQHSRRPLLAAASPRNSRPLLPQSAASLPSVAEPRQTPLNLALPSAPVELQRSPLERPGPLESAAPTHLSVTFVDRSLRGRLRQMTHASICAELRRALQAGGNTEPVLRSMQETGCTP